MGVVLAPGFPADSPVGVPLIGHRDNGGGFPVVTGPITATNAAPGFPAQNMQNPATHLKWRSTVASGDTINLGALNMIGGAQPNYIAVAGHNWGTTGAPVTLNTGGISAVILPNDDPVIFRFPQTATSPLTITLGAGGTFPEAAVIYAGRLLVLERSIKLQEPHVPITFGRRTSIVTGRSESGNFLGRVVLGEYRESKASFEWFTPEFYRAQIDLFLRSAQVDPFFWAWSPTEYPLEVGYVWLTNDAEPMVDPVTRRIALDLEMRGIA